MARRATRASVAELLADLPHPSEQELAAAARRHDQLMASVRGDWAGTPTNLLTIPTTYQQRVMRIWDAYNTDPLFGRMINRAVEFAANGFTWEVPGVPGERDSRSWWDRAKDWFSGRTQKLEREEEFWATWSAEINRGIPNVIPGLHEITRWCARHLLLSGMFVPAWKLGTIRLGKQTYIVPTQLTCYPASAITLVRQRTLFMEEEIRYRRPPPTLSAPLLEGAPAEATSSALGLTPDTIPLAQLGSAKAEGQTEAFALKYNWSPGDLTTLRSGQVSTTGQGIYPHPPFFGLLPQFLIRQKLFASDIALLDGILNYLLIWRVGDKDNPPQAAQKKADGTVVQEGTIAQIKALLQEGRVGPAIEMFVPYYVDLVIKMPDTNVLLSETKYIQSTLEILSGFGIMFARSTSGSRERMERINITNFEEFLGALRMYIGSFLQLLAHHIVRLNEGKLSMMPIWSPNPINTKNDAFIAQLFNLAKIGKVSLRTLLRYHGLDDSVELRRIASELGSDVDDLTDANAPVSYVQRVSQQPNVGRNPGSPDDDGGTETRITPTSQQGRPPKGSPDAKAARSARRAKKPKVTV